MTTISESRAAAADTRYRINYPNSRPRALKLIGLGDGGTKIARRVSDHKFQHVQVLNPENPPPSTRANATSPSGMFQAIAAEGHRLRETLEKADMIFMVATPADDLGVAAEIGQLGRQRNILITGVLVAPAATMTADAGHALELLRAATDMLVIVSDASYVIEMLTELGARPASDTN